MLFLFSLFLHFSAETFPAVLLVVHLGFQTVQPLIKKDALGWVFLLSMDGQLYGLVKGQPKAVKTQLEEFDWDSDTKLGSQEKQYEPCQFLLQ